MVTANAALASGTGAAGSNIAPVVVYLGSDSVGGGVDTLEFPGSGLADVVPAGTLVVLGLSWDGLQTVSSAADSHGNTYTILQRADASGGGALLYSVLTAQLDGGDVFEVIFTGDISVVGAAISVTPGRAADQTASAAGSSASLSSGATAATSQSHELLVEVMAHAGTLAGTAPFAFTDGATLDGAAEFSSPARSVHIGHRMVTTAGAYTATGTITGSQVWVALVCAFLRNAQGLGVAFNG